MRYRTTSRRVKSDPLFGTQPIAGIKKATGAAQSAAGTAAKTGAQYGEQATDIGSTLVPQLKRDVSNAPGFTPEQVNAQLVAGEQGLGGATSGLAGEAGLRAVRSRNVGSTAGTLDELAREKMRTSSGIGLSVANRQAELQQQQREQALKQLQGLYGTDVEAGLKAQGLVPEDINAWANANKTGWLQDVESGIDTGGNLLKAIKYKG
jgi:hypothetical protein